MTNAVAAAAVKTMHAAGPAVDGAAWKAEIIRLIKLALGNPTSTIEMGIVAAFGAIALILCMTKVGDLLGAKLSTMMRSILSIAIGGAIVVAVIAAADLYLGPTIGSGALLKWLPLIVGIVTLIAVVAPINKFIQISTYMESVFTLLISVAAMAVVIALASAGFDSFKKGESGMGGARDRKSEIESMSTGK